MTTVIINNNNTLRGGANRSDGGRFAVLSEQDYGIGTREQPAIAQEPGAPGHMLPFGRRQACNEATRYRMARVWKVYCSAVQKRDRIICSQTQDSRRQVFRATGREQGSEGAMSVP